MGVAPAAGAGPAVGAGLLVGRDGELARLVGVAAQPPGLAVIEGEAGIGKSRLVQELIAYEGLSGRRVLVGGCRRIREPFPLGPLLDALRDAGPFVHSGRLSPVAGCLRPLLPELAEKLPPACEPLGDRAAERHRVFRGLTELLTSVGGGVLVVEDAHWADEQTLDFLGYLLAHMPATLSVVVTFRAEEAGADIRAGLRPPASVACDWIDLPALDVSQTGVLAAAILDSGQPLSEEFVAYLHERTSGVPFALQELLALLRERGALIPRGAGWARRALEELDVPAGVRDSILERVGRLSPHAQAVAEAAAVLQEPAPVHVLAGTCRLRRGQALDGMTEALRAGLLEERGTLVGYRHMLAVQAVYESIPLPQREDLHARAAAAVRWLDPPPLGQIAHHLRAAQDYRGWLDAAELAAAQAAGLGDDTEAARLLEEILRTAPLTATRRAELTVKLGWSATEARRLPAVLDLFERALSGELPRGMRGELNFLTCLLHEQAGDDLRLVRRAAAAAVEDLTDQPVLAARAMVMLGFPWVEDIGAAEYAAWLDRALELVPQIDDTASAVHVIGKIAGLMCEAGDPRWAGLAERVLERTGGAPRHPKEVNAYRSIADTACYAGHYEMAERLLAAAANAQGGHRLELVTRTMHAMLGYARGAWQGLEETVTPLLDELRDRPQYWADAENVGACLALARGEIDAARRRLAQLLETALTLNVGDVLALPTGAYLRLASYHGDAEAALAQTAKVFRLWEVKRLWPLAVRALPSLIQALLRAGHAEAAAERVARFDDALQGLDAPFAPAALSHARGFLAAHDGGPAAAAAAFTRAAAAYDEMPCPYEAAQAREQAAAALFESSDPEAPYLLRAVIDVYEQLGARWDADRVTQVARTHGMSLPARRRGGRRGYGDALSPRERQVAELAANGLTNKEIADRLFVSAKTVEGHLHLVLHKLGLRSRGQLASFPRDVHEKNG